MGKLLGLDHLRDQLAIHLQKADINDEIVAFDKIPFFCDIEDIAAVSGSFSTDQQYLFDICTAISMGNFDERLANRKIGKLSHSRWLTTGSRILRLYASAKKPSKNLRLLAKYVFQVYAPLHQSKRIRAALSVLIM